MRVSPRDHPRTDPYDPSFLADIHLYSAVLSAEVERAPRLGALSGASLRGAIGERLHAAWCVKGVECAGSCQKPDVCKYPLLFGADRKDDAPRPFAIKPPVPDELLRIAHGLPVEPPFEVQFEGQDRLPRLSVMQDARLTVPVGATISWIMTFFGRGTLVAKDALSRIAGQPLPWSGGRLRVVRIEDALSPSELPRVRTLAGFLEAGDSGDGCLQLTAETPVAIRFSQAIDPRGAEYVRHVLTQCLVRAKRAYQESIGAIQPAPHIELPELEFSVSAARLYRMEVMRTGENGRTKFPMQGVLGKWRLAGDFSSVLPLLRVGELLGIGQHTTAGFGQIRCDVSK